MHLSLLQGFMRYLLDYRASFVLSRLPLPVVLATDFDGCLTNDRVYLNREGEEFVAATRKDGLGSTRIQNLGICLLIVSSERDAVVTRRGEKMGVEVIQNVANKEVALSGYLNKKNISWESVWYLGNDVNDLEVIRKANVSLCPIDAAPEIRKEVDVILPIRGGSGVLNYIASHLEQRKLF